MQLFKMGGGLVIKKKEKYTLNLININLLCYNWI